MRRYGWSLLLMVLFAGLAHGQPALSGLPEAHQWTPIPDNVYLQEVGRQIPSDTPVSSVAHYKDRVFAGRSDGLFEVVDGGLARVTAIDGGVTGLVVAANRLWAFGAGEAHYFDSQRWTAFDALPTSAHVYDITFVEPWLYVATSDGVRAFDPMSLAPQDDPIQDTRVLRHLAAYGQALYGANRQRLYVLDAGRFDGVNVIDWGELPASPIRDTLRMGSRVYIATGDGLAQLQGMTLSVIRGQDGLCYEDTTCLAEGFDGDLWIGTSRGAIRRTEGEYHYFAGRRWLPHDRVHDITVHNRTMYAATDKGIGIIEYEPYTLRKKAAYYERWLEEWGQKRLGFTHKLEWDGPTRTWMREISDNDAGFSTHYLAAQCFKYAVTGDESAREEAINFFKSLKWCEEITPMDGFPARSIWAVGETGHKAQHGSGGYPAEWHPTPDGNWEWKGDTSSDETDAHYYATAIFYELAAETDQYRELALEHLRRITTHIIDNGWVLRDLDGEPTVWARWDPEYLQRPKGYYARGLNGLEILSYVKTAVTLVGQPKFDQAYDELLAMDYHREVLRQKLVFPPDDINHSDDRLAWYVYFNILRYETDPQLRALYFRSFDRSWEVERIEHNPWFNFIYGGLTGNDCEADEAVYHLREWPLDCIHYTYRNSHRADLHTPEGYSDHARVTRALSPRERGPMRWSNTPRFDGGAGGRAVVDPSGWIEAYWTGRYFGLIEAPTTGDPELTTVEERGLSLGAEPYNGPARPF